MEEEVPFEAASNHNDLTQDVIEWEEEKIDLRKIAPSPHPSDSKASTPNTGSSKNSSNSSLFFGMNDNEQRVGKVNLDGSFQQVSEVQQLNGSVPMAELQTQQRTNKRRATADIHRHRFHQPNKSVSSFSIRNRRRRMEAIEQRQQQKQRHRERPNNGVRNPLRRTRSLPVDSGSNNGKLLLAKTPIRQNSTPSHSDLPGNANERSDGFSELLIHHCWNQK